MIGLSLAWFAVGAAAYLSDSTALVLAGTFADGAGLVWGAALISYLMLLAIIAVLAACAAVVLIRPAPEPFTDAVSPGPQPVLADRDPVA